MKFPILYEDNHLIVIDKPAGWIVQGAATDQESVLTVVKNYLKQKYLKPGDVFLGVVSRLDSPVTGVVPLARTSKGAARLSEQIRERKVQKRYWALVHGNLAHDRGTLRHFLVRREQETVTRVVESKGADVQEGILHYRRIAQFEGGAWIEVELETGRKHQIRTQLAHIGCPIVGDIKYGGPRWREVGIGLHSRSFGCLHPTLKTPMSWVARPPSSWAHYLNQHEGSAIWNQMEAHEETEP